MADRGQRAEGKKDGQETRGASRLGIPAAIILGAALIAGAILISLRWQISGMDAMRLDRWTGTVTQCQTWINLPGKIICDNRDK
jgi:hypothetical protein